MSREELAVAYVNGHVSRRMFIKRLMALGVTAGAAIAYAESLGAPPGSRAAAAADDLYQEPDPDDGDTGVDAAGAGVGAGAGANAGAVANAQAAEAVQGDPDFTG